MDVAVVMVMVVVVMPMVVMARTRVGGHGEHRQHGGDGDQLGETHEETLSSGVNRPELGRAASCLKSRPCVPAGSDRAGAGWAIEARPERPYLSALSALASALSLLYCSLASALSFLAWAFASCLQACSTDSLVSLSQAALSALRSALACALSDL